MEISITDKGMPQRNIFRAKQGNINRRSAPIVRVHMAIGLYI
jgi:hypothetical protein